MKRHMIGKQISEEELDNIKKINEANRTSEKIEAMEIKPTMQIGYNKDGTIKEEEIKRFIYELNDIKDK